MLTSTADRVRGNTSTSANARVDRQTQQSIDRHRDEAPDAIHRRLMELDREWDIERVIELEAPLTIGAGLALGTTLDRRWLAIPIFASAMFLLHAVQGWYPLLPLLRRMGFRTHAEIERERDALQGFLTAATPASGAPHIAVP